MQFNFNKLELRAQISLIAIGVAFISLFMPWTDFMGRSQNAFLEGEFIIFLPLLYPLVQIIRGSAVRNMLGYICVILPLLGGVFWVYIYTTDRYQEPMIGVFLFILATLGAFYGQVRSTRL
ncbi:hypothetical protein ACFL6E_05035 [Candidatus Neomarinimicrobiota bacterium]